METTYAQAEANELDRRHRHMTSMATSATERAVQNAQQVAKAAALAGLAAIGKAAAHVNAALRLAARSAQQCRLNVLIEARQNAAAAAKEAAAAAAEEAWSKADEAIATANILAASSAAVTAAWRASSEAAMRVDKVDALVRKMLKELWEARQAAIVLVVDGVTEVSLFVDETLSEVDKMCAVLAFQRAAAAALGAARAADVARSQADLSVVLAQAQAVANMAAGYATNRSYVALSSAYSMGAARLAMAAAAAATTAQELAAAAAATILLDTAIQRACAAARQAAAAALDVSHRADAIAELAERCE